MEGGGRCGECSGADAVRAGEAGGGVGGEGVRRIWSGARRDADSV